MLKICFFTSPNKIKYNNKGGNKNLKKSANIMRYGCML